MSRIGKQPVPVPQGVTVTIEGQQVTVKGSKGQLSRELPSEIAFVQEGEEIVVTRRNESRNAKQRHGLVRTLISNMVEGVSKGYEKKLEIQGVGYRASLQGQKLVMALGYSHPVEFEPPPGIQFAVEKNTSVTVTGIDKEIVGNTAARVRAARPPEPYKGKGVRYLGEQVRRKAGKAGK
ncbi:MAG: 50S ribosomal protein L6 [Phormidesmis priestleyi]|uniref:Large ribosomal subunit protein uL6 n=1 Tax=Phormidesmis priestleyi TaxID=268141 RepID=A0A2W4XR07_9CYAN|nr:MAG: 50S ribosomal protein L6 [Phormidesmis priestleyi]